MRRRCFGSCEARFGCRRPGPVTATMCRYPRSAIRPHKRQLQRRQQLLVLQVVAQQVVPEQAIQGREMAPPAVRPIYNSSSSSRWPPSVQLLVKNNSYNTDQEMDISTIKPPRRRRCSNTYYHICIRNSNIKMVSQVR